MSEKKASFQSYCWKIGTTSFRMAEFHRKIEEQLELLDQFWKKEENKDADWRSCQCRYYEFMFEKGFISGNIDKDEKKAKDARQKTSGLAGIGLIDKASRRLTEVGEKLLEISREGIFRKDNCFKIPADSFLYLHQMMKTSVKIGETYVRPFFVVGRMLKHCEWYLTDDEFAYVLPLCISSDILDKMIKNVEDLRHGKVSIDDIIRNAVLSRENYQEAREIFLNSEKSDHDVMNAGMNRDGNRHDSKYADLYKAMCDLWNNKDEESKNKFVDAASIDGFAGRAWKKHVIGEGEAQAEAIIEKIENFNKKWNLENNIHDLFFSFMHLFKIKQNLHDYKDLNKRYLGITDAFLFYDNKVRFSPIFEYYFKAIDEHVFNECFERFEPARLQENIPLDEINEYLTFDEKKVLKIFEEETGKENPNIEDLYNFIEEDRRERFDRLIDDKFSNDELVYMIQQCETRKQDDKLRQQVGGDADVPTIFEYVVAISWYKISGRHGKILDYMNLSLDADLYPRTHAGGGKADIEYRYENHPSLTDHAVLLECTLMEGTTQRHGEIEPVTRHLLNYLIDRDVNAACIFIAPRIHPFTVSDFRNKRNGIFYRDDRKYVDGMKILPLATEELKTILKKNAGYDVLHAIFQEAFENTDEKHPPRWYATCVKGPIDALPACQAGKNGKRSA